MPPSANVRHVRLESETRRARGTGNEAPNAETQVYRPNGKSEATHS